MVSYNDTHINSRYHCKPNILIVDDEQDVVRSVLSRILLHYHGAYEPIICVDGEEAILTVQSKSVALILLDINMPVLDGVEVCEFLKSHEQFRDIPVLISSGYVNDEVKDKLQDMGIQHFLDKPYTMNNLLDKMDSMLGVKASS